MVRLARRLSLALLLVVLVGAGLAHTAQPARATPTTTPTIQLYGSQNPSQAGQVVTFYAVISCGAYNLTGESMYFFVNGNLFDIEPIEGTVAVSQTASLPVGADNVQAYFPGDSNCTTAVSNVLARSVLSPAGAIQLTSSANPSNLGQSVTFTATLSCFTSGETVTFLDGNTPLATKSINNRGVAKYTTSNLSGGQHSITVSYPGDTNCLPVSSTALRQTVNGAPTQNGGIILTPSSNPSRAGSPVTFTANVTCSGYPPAGTVTFLDGTTPLGSANVNGAGQAVLRVTTLTAGSHTITASVSGSPCGPLTSAPLTQTVTAGFAFGG